MLNFKSPNTASFVTDRHEASWAASGSNTYDGTSGVKTLRLNLTGQGWLDPASIVLRGCLQNNILNLSLPHS